MTFRSRPGASGSHDGPLHEAQVEYRLMRDALARDVRRGRVPAVDVCDAHPELLRAARNVGRPSADECPICETSGLVEVTYVFGAGLPPGGRCPGTTTELERLRRRPDPVLCYDVEVCPECAWHHLVRRYAGGGRPVAPARAARQGRSAPPGRPGR